MVSTRAPRESARARAGPELYEAIFKHYTKKQWDKYPEELDASVLARIPVREDVDDRYFSDPRRGVELPADAVFENMIMGDPNVTVRLNVDFFEHREALRKMAKKCVVFTGPIDAYYASQGLPKLEYRSLRFVEEYHGHPIARRVYQPCLQLNYPGPEVEHTRIVEYKHKPNQPRRAREQPGTVIFKERRAITANQITRCPIR